MNAVERGDRGGTFLTPKTWLRLVMLVTDLQGALSGHNLHAAVTKADGSTSAYSTCTETWSRPVRASQRRKTGKIPRVGNPNPSQGMFLRVSTRSPFGRITMWIHLETQWFAHEAFGRDFPPKTVFQHRSRVQSIIQRFPRPQFWDDTALERIA